MTNLTAHPPQIKIPAIYMRGGTSKGVFFHVPDLPLPAQQPGPARDAILLRTLGSPDPYGKQIDGLGNASSSTSKAVLLARSTQPDHDVDYLFGQVAIDKPLVDWSGNCGNLSAAVGPCAIAMGLIDPARIPHNGLCTVRIWQANIGKTIMAQVPICNGQVQESGDFALDGVSFPAAEVQAAFMDPADEGEDGGAMFPTGQAGGPNRCARGRPLCRNLDQCGHPDDLSQCARPGLHRLRACRAISMAMRRPWRAWKRFARLAPSRWA